MINTNDVEYVYLKHLGRLPTSLEESQSIQYEAVDHLEKYIMSTDEYKNKHNVLEYDYIFENNVYTLTDISGEYDTGCVITNGVWKFESSASFNKCKSLLYNSTKIPSITNIDFKVIDQEETLKHTSQSLDMNRCVLRDVISSDNITITLQKFAFQEEKELFVNQVTIESEIDCDLRMSQVFEQPLSHNTSTEVIDKETNEYKHLSIIEYKSIKLINIYSCTEQFIFEGSTLEDGNLLFNFVLSIKAKEPLTFNFMTSTNKNTEIIIEWFNLYNKNNQIIDRHMDYWSKLWNTNIDIVSKQNITELDKKTVKRIDFITKKALFDMYCDPYSVDLMFQLPSLIMMQPELAKDSLTRLIHGIDFKYNRNEKVYLYDKALLSINIWNYYRVTQDKNWLQLVGFPCMKSIAEFFLKFINLHTGMLENTTGLSDVMNNNILTNYLVNVSYKLTLQAIYDLNYHTIERYREITDKLVVTYFEEDVITNVSTTDIRVSLGSNNGLYHFDFYDGNDDYIGYQFGGTNGKRLSLLESTTYSFSVDDSLVNHPFKLKTRIYNEVTYTTDTIYHIFHNVNDPPYTNDSSVFHSYSLDTDSNLFSIYREKFNHLYGENAFTTNLTRNVIIPYNNYEINKHIEYVEPYLLLTPYYNTLFDSNKSVLVDIINDNIKYYSKVSVKNEFNTILEAGLTALVSQYKDAYIQKRTQINLFYNKLMESLSIFDNNDTPWGGNNSRFTMLYMMLTCVFELTPYGEINHNRILSQHYELNYSNRNILPDPFKSMKLTNLRSLQNNEAMIINTLYIDNPIGNLIEGTSIVPVLDETDMKMSLNIDLSKVFPAHIPDNLMFHIVLQDDGDFTKYNIDNMRAHCIPFISLQPIEIQFSSPPSGIIETVYNIDDLYNRNIHLYMEFDGNESFTSKNIEILKDNINPTTNPTIHCTISYLSYNVIDVNMTLNTLNNTYFDTFSNVKIFLNYKSDFVNPNNIDFIEPDNTYTYTTKNNINLEIFEIDVFFGKEQGGVDINIGKVRFYLNTIDISVFQRIQVPFSGYLETNRTSKRIHITNLENFPPDIYKSTNRQNGLIRDVLTFIPNTLTYPINTLHTLSINTLDIDDRSIVDLIEHNKSLYDVVCGDNYTLYLQNDFTQPRHQLKCFAKGQNVHNMLMMNDTVQSNFITITECSLLTDFLSTNMLELRNVYCGNNFTIVRTKNNKFYGIGDNTHYNLGFGNNTSTTVLQECTLINNLISGSAQELTHFNINDSSIILCFGNNTIYGIGKLSIFSFLKTSINTVQYDDNYTLTTPTLLLKINQFVDSRYIIDEIHIGKEHLKFRLKSLITERYEWYGIGKNTYLGINPKIETMIMITNMKRLHHIESLLDNKYDNTYDGLSLIDDTKYKLIPVSNGIPIYTTYILDTSSNKIYYIGKLDESTSEQLEWTLLVDLNNTVMNNPDYISVCSGHIVLGSIEQELPRHIPLPMLINGVLTINSPQMLQFIEDFDIVTGSIVNSADSFLMETNTSFDYVIEKDDYPKRNFIIIIDCKLEPTTDMRITYGNDTEFKFGFLDSSKKYRIQCNIQTGEHTIESMTSIDNLELTSLLKTNSFNEFAFVVDNDNYQEIAVFLNKKKIGFESFSGSDIYMDNENKLTVTNYDDSGVIEEIKVYDTIPPEYLVNAVKTSNLIQPSRYISQVSYNIDVRRGNNAEQRVIPAFNNSYPSVNTYRFRIWKGENTSRSLWTWIDLGRTYTLSGLRIWQFFDEGNEHSIGDFRIFLTNDFSLTSSHPSTYIVSFKRDKQLINWSWIDGSGITRTTNSFGYGNDPTSGTSKNQSPSKNYHRFDISNMNFYYRTGRYLFLQLIPANINTWGVVNEIKLYGYEPY